MHPIEEHYRDLTRRMFFGRAAQTVGAGLGGAALASLMGQEAAAAVSGVTHFAPGERAEPH